MKRILLACISLFFLGCGNFLDINPESEVVNDDMFSTAEGVEDALYGVYMSMVKEDMYGGDMSVLIPELLGQNFVTDDGTYRYLSTLNFVSQSAKYIAKDMWKASYLVISYLNNIIENLDQKSVKDFEYYDLYRGEALGLRAAIHFDLLRLFAVHINSMDESAKAKAIPYVTKYTFKGTVHSYNKDITEAIKQFMTAVKIAKEVNMKTEVVNEYNYALLMALKKDRLTYEPILNEAFEYGYSFSDEDLKIINLSFIASTYLDKTYSLDSSKRDEISKRMSDLYGEDWQLSTKELAAKLDAEYSLRNQK